MVRRYKAIKQPLLVWVIRAARKCGLNLLGLRTGTAYAEAHEEVSLSTYDLQPLSDLIAKSKTRVEIPEEIASYLDEITDLRTRVCVWYRSNTAASDSARIIRNKTHRDRTTDWRQARKRVRHLYPPSMLNNPRLSDLKNASHSPASNLAMSQAYTSQNVVSQHETKTKMESTPGNGNPDRTERFMVSESAAENKDSTEDGQFMEKDTFAREERSIKDEPLGADAVRAFPSEGESHDMSTSGFEFQSTKTSDNDKRKRHKLEKKKQKERLGEKGKSASEMQHSLGDPGMRTTRLPRRIFLNGAWHVLDESTHY